jgi:cytochrome c oxidase subunit 2
VPFRQQFTHTFGLEVRIAATVFGLVAACMLAAALISWRRRRRGKPSAQRSEHNPVELTYLGVVAAVAVFLIILSFSANHRETGDPPARLTVRVTAFQWCWRFRYVGRPVTVTGQCAGHSLPTLVLPSGEPVRIQVTSDDVVHGFWIPHLDWKSYAYPDHVNSFTVTLTREGRWIGRCSEFCGLLHFQMDFYLQVVPPRQFDRWLNAGGRAAPLAAQSAGGP